jgi:CRISPR-associated protein Csh1
MAGKLSTAVEQFNLRASMLDYLSKGDIQLVESIKNTRSLLRDKINLVSNEDLTLESDEEFYYAVGQLARYFVSKIKVKESKQSLANSVLGCYNTSMVKNKLKGLYLKVNYDISLNSTRFNKLYNAVCQYSGGCKVNQSLLIAGYLADNLMY